MLSQKGVDNSFILLLLHYVIDVCVFGQRPSTTVLFLPHWASSSDSISLLLSSVVSIMAGKWVTVSFGSVQMFRDCVLLTEQKFI